MKTLTIIPGLSVLCWIIPPAVLPQEAAPAATTPTVTERGPHHNVVRWRQEHAMPDGTVVDTPHGYVTLATGLNHIGPDGAFTETRELIELLADGAAATHGQHQLLLAPSLDASDVIVVVAPDGQRLTSHLLALAYFNAASGESVTLSVAKDSAGELHPPNQVVYPDALTDVSADVRVTYRRNGVEADLIL